MKLKDWYSKNKKHFSLSELNFIFKNFGIDNLIYLYKGSNQALDKSKIKKLNKIKEDKSRGFPLALSLNKEDFFGFTFKVSRDTLIPRPETELLAEAACKLINRNKLDKILDLCCGCGNIGISLDKIIEADLNLYLSDSNLKSLAVAGENAIDLGSKVKIIASDLFSGFKHDSFDLIITNPPYVESENIKGSLAYEPKLALDGGKDGLNFLRKIVKNGHKYLKQKGYLIVEFGYNQKEPLQRLIQLNSHYKIIEWIKDYGKNWRGVILQKRNDKILRYG
ncbi:MAG: peptide chain release factor N(5)-glutamine methyltransferase [Candidatus Omnitrophica bacterium]|nr:peptide chain release factor N(5)-glutamine methyltransferase [Candidatus Omnitrophota bacterium]